MTNRYTRQADIVPAEALSKCHATVIGVGAVGRQVAAQLAAIGTPRIQLIDHDKVEEVNLAAQGYHDSDLGYDKVYATAQLIHRINANVEVEQVVSRYTIQQEVGNILFCCVDSIETRKFIWENTGFGAEFWVDGRMSAETVRVLAANDMPGKKYYPTTLFAGNEAYQGSCTAKTTIFTANICAGLMVEQLARHLRNIPVDRDLLFNLLTSELSVDEEAMTPA